MKKTVLLALLIAHVCTAKVVASSRTDQVESILAQGPFWAMGGIGIALTTIIPQLYITWMQSAGYMHDDLTDKQKNEVKSIIKEYGLDPDTIHLFSTHDGSSFCETYNSIALDTSLFDDTQALRSVTGYLLEHSTNKSHLKESAAMIMLSVITSRMMNTQGAAILKNPLTQWLCIGALLAWYSRYTERNVEIASSRKLGCAKHNLREAQAAHKQQRTLFEMKKRMSYREQLTNFILKCSEQWKQDGSLGPLFALAHLVGGSHPSPDARIRYLQPLADEEEYVPADYDDRNT